MAPQTETMAFTDLMAQGGWSMYPIYLCSVLTVAAFVKKALDLRRARLQQTRWFDEVVTHARSGDLDEAEAALRGVAHPGASVSAAIVAALRDAPAQAEAEARRAVAIEVEALERGVGLLAFLAQVAPLLGLLGTVLGMVDLFMGLQGAGSGNLEIGDLASGIWKALLTTAAGLTVAVPALAGHTYLTSRYDRVRLRLLDGAQRLLFAAEVASVGEWAED